MNQLETSADARSVLIVVSSMAMGGPQKSLIGLLERLDNTAVNVDLMVLSGRPGDLDEFVPAYVRIVPTSPEVAAATLARGTTFRSIRVLGSFVRFRAFPSVAWHLARGIFARGGRQKMRQKVWRAVAPDLPRVEGRYDAAFGILGLSTYAVIDLVDAQFKYHWVRSDTRILQRDEDIEREYFSSLSGALAVSDMCSDIFQEVYPNLRGRTIVYKNDIPSGVGSEARSSVEGVRQRPLSLLTVSRLDPLKGIEIAVEACAILKSNGCDVRWTVAGSGPELAQLERSISERGIGESFVLLGNVLDVSSMFAASDIYVHPSRTEGRSNSVEEAKALGLPIVATAYATVADQIEDGVSGLVCEINAPAVASAIMRLVHDPEYSERLGRQAKLDFDSEVSDPNFIFAMLASGQIRRIIADTA